MFPFSALQGVLEGALLLLLKLTACANMADCKSPAPVRPGSWVTVCVSCVFYLSSRSGCYPSSSFLLCCVKGGGSCFGRSYQEAPRWATFLCNAEEPHSYSSPSLHLLELATSHFASDPSINSWVPRYLAVSCDSCIFLHAGIAASEWVGEGESVECVRVPPCLVSGEAFRGTKWPAGV